MGRLIYARSITQRNAKWQKSVHKTTATAIDNISQEWFATQHRKKACTMLEATKALKLPCMSAPTRWGSTSQTSSLSHCDQSHGLAEAPGCAQAGDCIFKLPPGYQTMGNTFLYKQVSWKLTHPRDRLLCVFVKKTHKDQSQRDFFHICQHIVDQREDSNHLLTFTTKNSWQN